MFLRSPRVASSAVAALFVALASVVSQQSQAAMPSTTVVFRVVQPDGSVAPSPVVVVSVLGESYYNTIVSRGGAAGEIVVPLPAADPVAAQRLADGEPVNLLIRVFDKPPGSADINAAYVTASIGVDVLGVLRELSEVNGQTITLQPGRTAFENSTESSSDLEECQENPNDLPDYCYIVDYPEWAEHTLVPLADNHGAGVDMKSHFTYRSTLATTTGIAVQAGAAGFIEANGTTSFEKEQTEGLAFSDRGNSENRKVFLDTYWRRERAGMCYKLQGAWQCQLETTYRPQKAIGTFSTLWSKGHDGFIRQNDCWAYNDGFYSTTEKNVSRQLFSLRLGPSESWAIGMEKVLYANTTITQQTASTKSHLRKWSVTTFNKTYHYMFVPDGLPNEALRGRQEPECVNKNIPSALTHASNTNLGETVIPGSEPFAQEPHAPSTGEPVQMVCSRQPDRCD